MENINCENTVYVKVEEGTSNQEIKINTKFGCKISDIKAEVDFEDPVISEENYDVVFKEEGINTLKDFSDVDTEEKDHNSVKCEVERKETTAIQVEQKWKYLVSAFKKYNDTMRATGIAFKKKPEFFDQIGEIIGDTPAINPKHVSSLGLKSVPALPVIESEDSAENSVVEADIPGADDQQVQQDIKMEEEGISPETPTVTFEESIKNLVAENAKSVEIDRERLKLIEEITLRRQENEKSRSEEVQKREKEKLDAYKEIEMLKLTAYRERTAVMEKWNQIIQSVAVEVSSIRTIMEEKL